MDFPPGLTVVEYREVPNITFPDGIRIVLESETNILQRMTEMIGFVHPFKFKTAPWTSYALYLVLSNVKDTEAKLWLSTDETEAKRVSTPQWWIQGGREALGARARAPPLLPLL